MPSWRKISAVLHCWQGYCSNQRCTHQTNPPGNVLLKFLLILQSGSAQRGVDCWRVTRGKGTVVLYKMRNRRAQGWKYKPARIALWWKYCFCSPEKSVNKNKSEVGILFEVNSWLPSSKLLAYTLYQSKCQKALQSPQKDDFLISQRAQILSLKRKFNIEIMQIL